MVSNHTRKSCTFAYHQVFDPFRRSLGIPGCCCVIYSYGVADDLAGVLTFVGEVEQACLLNFIFLDAGCVSKCHRSCPALGEGEVAGEWQIDGRSVGYGDHVIAFG